MTEADKDYIHDFQEHLRRAVRAWREGCASLVTDEFIEKGKEGQREALLAVRSLIDAALQTVGTEDQPPRHEKKVKVEPDEGPK